MTPAAKGLFIWVVMQITMKVVPSSPGIVSGFCSEANGLYSLLAYGQLKVLEKIFEEINYILKSCMYRRSRTLGDCII